MFCLPQHKRGIVGNTTADAAPDNIRTSRRLLKTPRPTSIYVHALMTVDCRCLAYVPLLTHEHTPLIQCVLRA